MATAGLVSLPPPSTAARPRRASRPSKGLSLNFPILPPTAPAAAATSPRTKRADTCPHAQLPLPSTSTPQSLTATGSDILTLVAAQERRVLELREELDKAESELGSLKKKWAVYEASKKRGEVTHGHSHSRSAAPVPLGENATNPGPRVPKKAERETLPTVVDVIDLQEERRRRKDLLELQQQQALGAGGGGGGGGSVSGPGRKGSSRVFQGGRHTRALSLLSHQQNLPSNTHTPVQSLPSTTPTSVDDLSTPKSAASLDEAAPTPVLDGFISLAPRAQSFGQRYKDMAAAASQQRMSLSPAAADALLKSGKQVVDGVRDGLWTFFEDIRQATVGDEAVNGPNATNARPRRRDSKIRAKSRSSQEQERRESPSSFWTEFGLESPAAAAAAAAARKRSADQAHARRPLAPRSQTRLRSTDNKSSTSSQNVPELLPNDTSDDEWEQWDSSSPPPPVNSDKHDEATSPSDEAWPRLSKADSERPKGLNIENAI